jgi:hypothetical protein
MQGNWAAAQLGLTSDAAAAYANDLLTKDLENQTLEVTLQKVSDDFVNKGISEQEVAMRMNEFLHAALKQIELGR